MSARIPLVDLRAQHREVAGEIREALERIFESSAYILGPEVAAFEADFAAFCGAPNCVAVGSGTDALEIMVRAAGLGPGDEVLLPANTFIATAMAVLRAGAVPALVDAEPVHLLMDPQAAADRVGRRSRALLPVHLFGQMAPMEALAGVANAAGLLLLEDAAQAHGARRHGRGPGAFGLAAAFSFYPAKNLGAYGDAGAVVTASAEIARRARALRNFGSEEKNHHPELGFNSRLDAVQAVVLRAKLARLRRWNDERRAAARRYDELLAGLAEVTTPGTLEGNEHAWHLYVVRLPRRDAVLAGLREAGVEAAVHYPVPLHLQGALGFLRHGPGDFPVAERAAREVLSLPLYPGITAAQQERVADEIRRALRP